MLTRGGGSLLTHGVLASTSCCVRSHGNTEGRLTPRPLYEDRGFRGRGGVGWLKGYEKLNVLMSAMIPFPFLRHGMGHIWTYTIHRSNRDWDISQP